MMRLEYDPKIDAVYLGLSEAKIARSKQVDPGVVIDFASDGSNVGVEVFSTRLRKDSKAAKPRKRKLAKS